MVFFIIFYYYYKLKANNHALLANNLYGWAQCLPLPIGFYKWVSERKKKELKWMEMTRDQEIGYIVEVDLEYPPHLHLDHSTFPLAPEHIEITKEMLSPYARGEHLNLIMAHLFFTSKLFSDCLSILNPQKTSYTSKKLCATFNKREKYVLHYMNLQQYLNLGLKLKKVHRVLEFKQSPFLTSYIEHCTRLRKETKSEFQKRLWKIYVNGIFGKMIERTREYLDCQFILRKDLCKKWIQSPRFSNVKIISEDFVVIFLKRAHVTLNKPLAIGFTILENSKYFMYDAYYLKIRPNFEHCVFLMSDTDCMVLAVRTKTECNNLDKIAHHLDYSNYPESDKKFSKKRHNALGFFKDELMGKKMEAFCGLRSKTYAFKLRDEKLNALKLHSKCKGVTRSYRKKITFQDYKSCVQTFSKFEIDQFTIRSKNHKLQTQKINKLCFSSFDDKRYLLQCGVHSVPYGSQLIKKCKKMCVLCKEFNPLKKRFA
jgi:hypothetical protein